MALSLPIHGGDLAGAEALWGKPAEGWLDLSTGINPWPYPIFDIAAAVWHRLPGAAEENALLDVASRRWNIPSRVNIVAAPGSQPLIQAVPRLIPPGRVAVIGPTYGEHARAWGAAGHDVAVVSDLASASAADAVVVVNPNNPDGRVIAPDFLIAVAPALAAKGGLLVVDEAFADTIPAVSVASRVCPGLVVLRSFGKFYGLAGLRLGFAVAMPDLAARLAAMMGPWAVSGPALAVGAKALADDAWSEAMRARLRAASVEQGAVLTRRGFEIVGGADLFLLGRHAEAAELYQHLGRAGILVRAFADRADLLRFGLAGCASELERLDVALGSFSQGACRG